MPPNLFILARSGQFLELNFLNNWYFGCFFLQPLYFFQEIKKQVYLLDSICISQSEFPKL